MTKEEILKAAEHCTIEYSGNCSGCPLSGKGCISIFTQYIINKENEPAPAGTDTSSKNNNYQLNDSANLAICQEKIADIKEDLLLIYEDMTNEEQRAWELGEIFNQMTNLLKSGDTK